ncbi:Hsp20/alpha crystallin family protein [Candidatus Falkowbacteria bacterium]|nr:Hsp20/alpha crystallin family protein [Candidatus Falkowbacteria bacterium]
MLKNLFPLKNQKPEEENFFPVQKEGDGEPHTWLAKEYEGQLSVDVYHNDKEIVVRSTVAGVKPEDLNILVNNDLLTIRGKREAEANINPSDYLYRECYWGGFSRTIVLPQDVKADKIKAILKNGLLTIILPKAVSDAQIKVKEEF